MRLIASSHAEGAEGGAEAIKLRNQPQRREASFSRRGWARAAPFS